MKMTFTKAHQSLISETAVSDRTIIMAGRQLVKNNVWKFGIGIGEARNLVVFVSLQVI